VSLYADHELKSLRRRIRQARRTRALFVVIVALDVAAFTGFLMAGKAVPALLFTFAAVLMTVNAFWQTASLRMLRRQEARLLPEVHPRPYLAPAVALAAGTGVTMTEFGAGMARLGAALGSCAHANAVPVDLLVTGETVAWLCPDCGAGLPAEWAPAQRRYTTWAEDGERFCPWCPDEGCWQTCAGRNRDWRRSQTPAGGEP
jgi:hypothetical protein